jgi:hypothetical protein
MKTGQDIVRSFFIFRNETSAFGRYYLKKENHNNTFGQQFHPMTLKQLLLTFSLLMPLMAGAQTVLERTKPVVVRSTGKNQSVAYAAVANSRTGFCFQSDVNGRMKLSLAEGDTLMFRSMGYRDTSVVISAYHMLTDTIRLDVAVKPRMIKEVEVLAFRSYAAFKYMFANLKLEDDKKSKANINFDINTKEIAALAKAAAGTASFSIGLGALYGKDKYQKYNQFLAHEKSMERVNRLTSHDNIHEFTGLSDAALDSFVIFLRSHNKFTPQQSDYDIMETIKNAFEEFLAMRDTRVKE